MGFAVRRGDTTLPKHTMFGELVGGAGCVWGQKKGGWGVSWTTSELSASTLTSGRLQPRTTGNGWRRTAESGAQTLHGERDRCRESQGWTTAYSSMSERDGKYQAEDNPKQAGSCWFARHN